MTSFTHKKLSSDKSLSELIKEERQKRGLSLEQVSLTTQIALDYLEKLEQGDYRELPGEVYVQQFIKKLAKFFKFSGKTLMSIYQKEKESQLTFFQPPPLPSSKKSFFNLLSPKVIKIIFVGLIIVSFLGYLGWEIRNIFAPPILLIESPATQTVTLKPTIAIKGKTRPEATVLINQQEIIIKPDGSFSQEVDLTIGLNLFEISASKKHSKKNIVTLSILRQPATASDVNPAPLF